MAEYAKKRHIQFVLYFVLGVLIFRLFPIFSNGFWNCSEDVVYLYLYIVVYILSMRIYTVFVGAGVNTFSLLEYL